MSFEQFDCVSASFHPKRSRWSCCCKAGLGVSLARCPPPPIDSFNFLWPLGSRAPLLPHPGEKRIVGRVLVADASSHRKLDRLLIKVFRDCRTSDSTQYFSHAWAAIDAASSGEQPVSTDAGWWQILPHTWRRASLDKLQPAPEPGAAKPRHRDTRTQPARVLLAPPATPPLVSASGPTEPNDDRCQRRVLPTSPRERHIAAWKKDEVSEVGAIKTERILGLDPEKTPVRELHFALGTDRLLDDRTKITISCSPVDFVLSAFIGSIRLPNDLGVQASLKERWSGPSSWATSSRLCGPSAVLTGGSRYPEIRSFASSIERASAPGPGWNVVNQSKKFAPGQGSIKVNARS